jgi:hypothetical protein
MIARMTATSIPWYVILQEVMATMVDCEKGTRDRATQQPTKFLCRIARERAMITKAQSARDEMHRNDNIVDAR